MTSSMTETETNIGAFVQWVKNLVPNVSEVEVQPRNDGDQPSIESYPFSRLVVQLFQPVRHIEYTGLFDESGDHLPSALQLDGINDLVHIKCTFPPNADEFGQLAMQNALTLQSLILVALNGIDIAGLVKAADGSYISYPCLHTLDLLEMWPPLDVELLAFSGTMPFPSLRALRLRMHYPFSDDTLFRGNAATLERLDIFLDHPAISAIIDHRVFTPTSHPNLRHVQTEYSISVVPDLFGTNAEALRFEFSIGPRAAARNVDWYEPGVDIASAFISPETCSSIQILYLSRTSLVLWDVIALIKLLPLLTDLHTRPSRLGMISAGVSEADLPAFVISAFAPTGQRFRCWHLQVRKYEGVADIAPCVLLLALVCPNFTYAAIDPAKRMEFMKSMEECIASDMFKEHAPRLHRLLFHGWASCKAVCP
ncbi:hypothetical protein IWW47_000870 [Coemansia sp. RSA 2052]|nr:hypothetical protein IWW47_000870 [Coemansia sp. RSA 2052]